MVEDVLVGVTECGAVVVLTVGDRLRLRWTKRLTPEAYQLGTDLREAAERAQARGYAAADNLNGEEAT